MCISPLQADGRLDWRDIPLAPVGTTDDLGVPPVRSDELPSPTTAIVMSVFCALGLMMTAQWSLLIVTVLAAAVSVDRKVHKDSRIIGRATLAAFAAAGCWLMIRHWDFLDADIKSAQALAVSVTFCLSLGAVGDALRRASRLQQANPRLHLGLYAMGAGCQGVGVIIGLFSGLTLLLQLISAGTSP